MLYLITHAHTLQKRNTDAAVWDLSAAGYQQAEALARLSLWDGVDRVVVSSEPKTRLTVAPVLAAHRLPLTVDPRFDELRRGSGWVGDYAGRVAAVFAEPDRSVGGGETAADALARFVEGIDALRDAFPHETIALVGHGLTFSLYRAHLLGQKQVDFTDWQRLSFCAVAEVEWPEQRLVRDFQPVPGGPQIERGG
ncbi:MAG: histidine phosphatase family protein [Chloroflexi bacterium]|nr:histidine phosphatase family protein [Chloroflexota bacterium]